MNQTARSYAAELQTAIAAARDAAAAVHDLYERAAAASYVKTDGSPVTDADLAADRIIRRHLSAAFPADAILTEEGADDETRLANPRCWVVDPIDGTQQFIDRTGEFDILIALVVAGRPVLGVICQPTTGLLVAAEHGRGAWFERDGERQPLHYAPLPAGVQPRIVTSYWLGAPASLPALTRVAARLGGSEPTISPVNVGVNVRLFLPPDVPYHVMIGLKIDGDPTMAYEWDFAAMDLIIHEAGGAVTDLRGHHHRYNKPDPHNFGGILLALDPPTHQRVLAALAPELPGE